MEARGSKKKSKTGIMTLGERELNIKSTFQETPNLESEDLRIYLSLEYADNHNS